MGSVQLKILKKFDKKI